MMTHNDNVEPDETVKPIKEQVEQPTKKRKSAKEKFAESTGFDVAEAPVEEVTPKVTKEELGLTSSVEEEETTDETEARPVYKASAVEKVPAQDREGMQLAGIGRRRQVKRTKQTDPPRINRHTAKAFPEKGLGTVSKTTFKG